MEPTYEPETTTAEIVTPTPMPLTTAELVAKYEESVAELRTLNDRIQGLQLTTESLLADVIKRLGIDRVAVPSANGTSHRSHHKAQAPRKLAFGERKLAEYYANLKAASPIKAVDFAKRFNYTPVAASVGLSTLKKVKRAYSDSKHLWHVVG